MFKILRRNVDAHKESAAERLSDSVATSFADYNRELIRFREEEQRFREEEEARIAESKRLEDERIKKAEAARLEPKRIAAAAKAEAQRLAEL